jgi:hypothetical protein
MQACTAPVNEAPMSPIRAGTCDQTSTLRSSSAFGKQHKATFALKETDRSNCYKVEKWDAAEHVAALLYASNDLSRARAILRLRACRPRGRYTLRQNIRVLDRWPPDRAWRTGLRRRRAPRNVAEPRGGARRPA